MTGESLEAETVLELAGVSRSFGGAVPVRAVDDVSLTVRAGEIVALVGSSGSGKSTLLALMGALDVADLGAVRIAGHDVSGMTDAHRSAVRARFVGFVFQQFFLLPTLSAVENVALGLLYTGTDARTRRSRAALALERVGLGARLAHRPSQLSGGEQQRVAVARALVGEPSLVLADEPTGALDSVSGAGVMRLLQSVAGRGTAVVVVTHDREIAGALDRRIVLSDGRILSDETRRVAAAHAAGVGSPSETEGHV
ncbi:ABC transporter ATP-binding protein [Subtercola boreus]|uniref:ABC transporter ATP-binding protein n=1 Tax=Subtercola boreus TaxID=120213 RepID=A0A3E0W5V2_9MICO|nr:ABC transporter ATP-binding protein [Subtercola boreus]RFA17175.1 ABC transporter ATP-binding protein [Subtercola boreus]